MTTAAATTKPHENAQVCIDALNAMRDVLAEQGHTLFRALNDHMPDGGDFYEDKEAIEIFGADSVPAITDRAIDDAAKALSKVRDGIETLASRDPECFAHATPTSTAPNDPTTIMQRTDRVRAAVGAIRAIVGRAVADIEAIEAHVAKGRTGDRFDYIGPDEVRELLAMADPLAKRLNEVADYYRWWAALISPATGTEGGVA